MLEGTVTSIRNTNERTKHAKFNQLKLITTSYN